MTGKYTEIYKITAPSSAVYGATVETVVHIRNICSSSLYIGCDILYDDTNIVHPDYPLIPPNSIHSFHFAFTMPNKDVTVQAWSWYWVAPSWYDDDYAYTYITLEVPPPKGIITKKEFEYNESRGVIPVSDVPQNKRGLVHIFGRNDMSTTQRMGVYWFVADPDGLVVEEYSTWEAWPYTGAGSVHEFIGGRFDLDKVGKYTTWIELLMNPDDPQIVDRYIGDLCTVAAVVPEPEFRGFGVTEYTKR